MKYKNILFLIFLFLIQNTFSYGKEFIVLRSKPHGMFSVFHFVLFYLQEYENNKIDGLYINFAKTGLYYDEKNGSNWWEYYFEPIITGNVLDNITYIEENTYIDPNVIEFSNSLNENNALINKYIKVKNHINEKVNCFIKENFSNDFIIGIHYRGTDKLYYEAPRIAYSDAIQSVNKLIDSLEKSIKQHCFCKFDPLLLFST